jgi:hypothetical protein
VLKLARLHVFHCLQLELGHKVFVHVQEDIFNHDDAELHVRPDPIKSFEELIIMR